MQIWKVAITNRQRFELVNFMLALNPRDRKEQKLFDRAVEAFALGPIVDTAIEKNAANLKVARSLRAFCVNITAENAEYILAQIANREMPARSRVTLGPLFDQLETPPEAVAAPEYTREADDNWEPIDEKAAAA